MDLAAIFSKCKELYEAKLNEDLGTLKVIDPKFLALFKPTGYSQKEKPALSGSRIVGAQSPVNTVDTVTARQASDMFFGEGSQYLGMILRAGGNQVLAFSRQGRDYKGKETVLALIDGEAYTKIEKDQARLEKVTNLFYSLAGQISKKELTVNEAKTVLNSVFKAFKEAGVKLDAMVIGKDEDRLAKQSDRRASRAGAPSLIMTNQTTPRDVQNYKDAAKASLRSRLEKFKASRAQNYNTAEEFMAGAVKEGFMDKVNIDGFTYNLADDQLRLRDIAKPSGWHKSNAITYRLDTYHGHKLKDLSDQLHKLWMDKKEDPEVQTKIDALKQKFPPREIKVIMGMSGGSIVPQSVEVSKEKEIW